jgi:hypothetical protein
MKAGSTPPFITLTVIFPLFIASLYRPLFHPYAQFFAALAKVTIAQPAVSIANRFLLRRPLKQAAQYMQ